ncbi:TPA: hypothetical protein I7683_15170, partial [Vibrio vulnificus]|nr:hypothetical protein [Vibrio vulnificus]
MNIRTKPHHKFSLYMGDNRSDYSECEINSIQFNIDSFNRHVSNSTYIQNYAASDDVLYQIARAILLHWSRPAIQYLISSAS